MLQLREFQLRPNDGSFLTQIPECFRSCEEIQFATLKGARTTKNHSLRVENVSQVIYGPKVFQQILDFRVFRPWASRAITETIAIRSTLELRRINRLASSGSSHSPLPLGWGRAALYTLSRNHFNGFFSHSYSFLHTSLDTHKRKSTRCL